MVHLPRTCKYCGRKDIYHYSICGCPDSRLQDIDRERAMLRQRLERLDEIERDVLGLKAHTNT